LPYLEEFEKGKVGKKNMAALDPLYNCHIKKKFEKREVRSQKSEEYSSSGPPPELP